MLTNDPVIVPTTRVILLLDTNLNYCYSCKFQPLLSLIVTGSAKRGLIALKFPSMMSHTSSCV